MHICLHLKVVKDYLGVMNVNYIELGCYEILEITI